MCRKTSSGGYSAGAPPLPIPNREVKPGRADGTAPQCGRVGRRRPHVQGPFLKVRALLFLLYEVSKVFKVLRGFRVLRDFYILVFIFYCYGKILRTMKGSKFTNSTMKMLLHFIFCEYETPFSIFFI